MTDFAHVFVGSKEGWLRAFLMRTDDGSLRPAGVVQVEQGIGFFALAPNQRTLFVSYDNGVSAFDYDSVGQRFEVVGSTETGGAGTHLAVSPAGTHILVAHYAANLLSLLRHDSKSGLATTQELTPGEKAHQVQVSPDGQFVYVPCLGSDHIAQYLLGEGTGLRSHSTPSVTATGGPRHMAFHPKAPVAYVLTEHSSQLHSFDINPKSGALTRRAKGSVFMSPDALQHWSSDLQLTPDGDHLYAVNRDPPEIVHFKVLPDQSLARQTSHSLSAPVRAFAMDPEGRFLQIGGNDGRLVTLRIHPATGNLSELSSRENLGNIRQTVISYLPI